VRIWSLHPRYLDAKGLVALWRETLLAQAVVRGQTRGYKHHPQLTRFLETGRPGEAIAAYLRQVASEAAARGYAFDTSKIGARATRAKIEVTQGQMAYEWQHLLAKLRVRDPERWRQWRELECGQPHPMFQVIPGAVETWEVVASSGTLARIRFRRSR
jgi:hypothetical protein